ncbi:MAG: septum formation initiator family protein [Patescibacteria group bacterium]
MVKINKKNIFKRIIYNKKFIALIGFFVITIISLPLIKNLNKSYQVSIEIKELEQEINQIEYKNKDFKKLISYLESEQAIEEKARLNLGLKKEGEEVVIVNEKIGMIDPVTGEIIEINETINELDLDEMVKYKKWFYYFFK